MVGVWGRLCWLGYVILFESIFVCDVCVCVCVMRLLM